MDYSKIFSKDTLQKLNKKSAENLKTMLGDKSLTQTVLSSQELLSQIAKAEEPYKAKLEKLAVNMVKELYPIIDGEGIKLDAKLVDVGEVNKSLDEIKVNNPNILPLYQTHSLLQAVYKDKSQELGFVYNDSIDALFTDNSKAKEFIKKKNIPYKIHKSFGNHIDFQIDNPKKYFSFNKELDESISPEGRRRIINGITQGAALKGAFAFYLFKEHLDEIDPSLVEKYNQIMKNSFGIYDDPNAVAMMLSLLAQGHKSAGGSSKVVVSEIKVNNPTKPIIYEDSKAKKPYILISNNKIYGEYAPNASAVFYAVKGLTNEFLDNYFKKQGTKTKISGINAYWVNDYKTKNIEVKTDKGLDEIKVNQPFQPDEEFINTLKNDVDWFITNHPNNANGTAIINSGDLTSDLITFLKLFQIYKTISNNQLINLVSKYTNVKLEEIKINPPVPFTYEEPNGDHWGLLKTPHGNVQTEYNEDDKQYLVVVDQEIAEDKELLKYLEKYNTNINHKSNYVLTIPEKFVGKEQNINEQESSSITIKARAICFPMLVHELIKGLYELISLQGFKGDKISNQNVVNKVDKLEHEPEDIKYGKFIYSALNDLFATSKYNDPRIREFFFAEVYKLDDEDFISFIENAVNESLTGEQKRWFENILRDISSDLKADDYDETGIDEIKVNKPVMIWDTTKGNLGPDFVSKIKPGDIVKMKDTNGRVNELEMTKKWDKHSTAFFNKSSNASVLWGNDSIQRWNDINKIDEIKVNNPNLRSELVKLIDGILDGKYGGELLRNIAGIYKKHSFGVGFSKWIEDASEKEIFNLYQEIKKEIDKPTNEIKINNPAMGQVSTDAPKKSELGRFQADTVYNFIKENPGLSAGNIQAHVSNLDYGLSSPLRFGQVLSKLFDSNKIRRVQTKNPKTGKKIFIYFIQSENPTNEIKVNDPNLRSPLEIKSQKHWDRIWPILKSKGYKWGDGEELDNFFSGAHEFPQYIAIWGDVKDKEIVIYDMDIEELPTQIFEYSDKTINTTIERWKKENPKVDDSLAKQVIQRFDQIKGGLAQKLNIVSLPDELKKSNNFLNIDKYSFDDMVKLIKSLPENPDKIKKDAIQKFVSGEDIDKTLAQSYVARFMAKRDALKQGFDGGLEDEGFTKEDVKKYIPKFLQQNNAFLDPRNWKWTQFEQMLDALFPTQKTVGDEGDNNEASTDADRVYNKEGIEVYKGDDVHKCISYNPTLGSKRKKYGWCVTQPGNTNYDYYRFQDRSPTFYIVFDRNKTSEPEHAPFKDNWHAFVVQVNGDGTSYVVTGADNRGDNEAKTWDGIAKIVPAETWAKIKNLKDVFKPIKLSPVERGRKFASGKSLSLEEFKDLDQDEKILYIQGKSSKNQLSPEIKSILPEYKINLEGRSTTLANVAIDSGQKFSWDELKNNEALAKRYAIFRFRHTNYSKDPLPLPFVKYLDEPGKEKYLKIFDENLNFNLIEKFFGEKAASDYANEEASKLQYIPENAIKYLKDDKLKKLYSIYLKLTESWNFSDNFKLDEKNIGNLTDMPVQDVTPVPINQEQWNKLSTTERKYVIDLASKVNKDSKYSTLLYALPYVVKDGEKSYVLLPKSNKDFNYDKWVLMDVNGKTIKDNISGDSNLGSNLLITGYPLDNENINRIYNTSDLKGSNIKEIKVNKPQPYLNIWKKFMDVLGVDSIKNYEGDLESSDVFDFLNDLNDKENFGWSEDDIEKIYDQFEKFVSIDLAEIKIINPSQPQFPLEVEEKDYDKTAQWLHSLGYTWVNGDDLEIVNPFDYIHDTLDRKDINKINLEFADDVDEEYKELAWTADY
jgi:hypothetical protein